MGADLKVQERLSRNQRPIGWLSEWITAYGIGNGIALILFAGIVVSLPSEIVSVRPQVASQNGQMRSAVSVISPSCAVYCCSYTLGSSVPM